MMNKKLSVGDTVPSFKLKNQFGESVDMSRFIGKTKMIIYFYPKDDTPGCTKEACSFRDHFEVFREKGIEVFGISADSVTSHLNFAKKHRLSFTLLSDEKNVVRKMFGVPSDLLGLLPGRVTYIVDESGKIIHVFNSQFNVGKHVSEALHKLS